MLAPSLNTKRSVLVDGHKTSVMLEPPFWEQIKKIADRRCCTINELITTVDRNRKTKNLSSALRLFVLEHCLP